MANQFYKGRTNNHLTWVMVDATDFATPESALSAATKIKIYGKLRGGTGTNFVSSGTGSLTNDIQHVGASVTGLYTIALAKADLSDASAAWYDQYIISLSATGAAYQALIVDGGIDLSAVSGFQSRLSDIASAVLVVQSMASDAASAATQANSRVILIQSRLSDFQSEVGSNFSDIISAVNTAAILGAATLSGISDVQSKLSDVESNLLSFLTTTGTGLNASTMSDIRSAINGLTVSLDASNISDIASAVVAALPITSQVSDILSAVYIIQSRLSDFDSRVASDMSDLTSMLSQINSIAVASPTASDIASKVWADTTGAATASRVLLNLSRVSDLQSKLSDVESNLLSVITVTGVQLNASTLSDLRSAITAGVTATVSASDISDIASAVKVALASLVTTTGVNLNTSVMSDIRSAITAGSAGSSDLSDILSAATQINSRVLVAQSNLSDIYSRVLAGVELSASAVSDVVSAVRAGGISDPFHVNVREINSASLVGDGTIATPWDAE